MKTKISFLIEYAGLQLQVVKNEQGEDVTPLKPISDLFGIKWEDQRVKVSTGHLARFLGTCTPDIRGAGEQSRAQVCILLSRVAAYIMSINPDKVRSHGNASAADFLEAKLAEWADALHDYEELGAAFNLKHAKAQDQLRRQRQQFVQLLAVKNKTADEKDRQAVARLMAQVASEIGIEYQPELSEAS